MRGEKILGRTVPAITLEFQRQQKSLENFRNALKRSDQLASDELFVNAKKHTAEAAYAAHALPFEIFLLCMLLEEHKKVMRSLSPSKTIRILSAAEYFLRVCPRMFLTVFSTESFLPLVCSFMGGTTLGRKSISYLSPPFVSFCLTRTYLSKHLASSTLL
jgi:hypothetical protein